MGVGRAPAESPPRLTRQELDDPEPILDGPEPILDSSEPILDGPEPITHHKKGNAP